MSNSAEQRKLAAIMFTDMVGYSALAQHDDKLALELLEEHREILRKLFPEFNGIEIKTIGDAFLVEFGSALEAARCAIEIQRTLAKRNTDVTRDRRIEVKIGIHIGDVVHRGGDVYGDGVNIASRIEQLAGAGGICVSMDVERQIRNALEARFQKFSSADLKNISLPMDLFRIVLPWESEPNLEIGKQKTESGKKAVLIGALVLVVLGVGWWWMQRSKPPSVTTNPTNLPAPANVPDQKSVAVLPFVNLSDEKESEYFSDGVSEELLTVLQKIPGLHVAARTSAFSFKGKNVTAQEIGQKLGVANLVEGSVRKAGNSVRIAARLSRADTGQELWSENYTRDLKDVFAVQTELAQTIVEQLRAQLSGVDTKEKIQAEVQAAEKGGTKNVEAHQYYLQGRFFGYRHSEKDEVQALAAFQRAVELDPRFALAWAGLAQTDTWFSAFSSTLDRAGFDKHLADAREGITRALAIEPNLAEALLARSNLELNFDFNVKAAEETMKKALALAPSNPDVYTTAGNIEQARGNLDRAIEFYRQAVALDPVNGQARSFLAFNLTLATRFDEARAEYAQVVALNPEMPWAHAGVGFVYLLQGKFEEAVTAAEPDAADWTRYLIISSARWSQKRIPESDKALTQLTGLADMAAYQVAEAHAYRGDRDQAFEWLERARKQRDPGLGALRKDPFMENIRDDPRWKAFLHTVGLSDEQLR